MGRTQTCIAAVMLFSLAAPAHSGRFLQDAFQEASTYVREEAPKAATVRPRYSPEFILKAVAWKLGVELRGDVPEP